MNQQQIEKLKYLHKSLVMAFDVNDLEDCTDTLRDILDNVRKGKGENSEVIELLEKADAAIFDVVCEFEEYEIGGAFAAMVGNNSELRAIFKENVQYACSQIAEILRHNM